MSPRGRSARVAACCLTALLGLSLPAAATPDEEAAPRPVTAHQRAAVLDKVFQIFDKYYPDPALNKQMIARLEQEEAQGAYDEYTEMSAFTARLTNDMRAVSKDNHITIWPYEKLPDDLAEETRLGSPDDNYGFKKVEVLPGNIGYIKLTYFANTRTAAPTAIAAMNFVAHCDALILDLRSNGGGDESMARFLWSYLFPKGTHLVDEEVPSEHRVQQIWSLEWVPGPRLTDVPVYILLNKLSYSSSEHMAFALQQAGRAVVVGERTRGGSHAVKYLSFPEVGVNIRVPYTTTVVPGTQKSYTDGVVPDIPASTWAALPTAAVKAVSTILPRVEDQKKRFQLEWALTAYEAELEPAVLDSTALGAYAGYYGEDEVVSALGRLYLKHEGRPLRALTPLGGDDFMFEDPDLVHYRVKFTRNKKNRIDAFHIHDGDGDAYPPERRGNPRPGQ
jgi:retinol-binding protein 3